MEIKGQITENETLNAELYAVPEGVHGGIDHPVTYVESLDTENMVNLRDLESGVYILYGYFRPFAGSDATAIFSQKALVTIVRKDAGTHLQCIYPLNNQIQFASIEVDETAEGGYVYESSSVRMNDVVTVDDIPTTLPNPNKLTFSGAVEAEYDGSEAVEVVIPQGNGGAGAKPWRLINTYTIETEDLAKLYFNTDMDGNPFELTEVYIVGDGRTATTNSGSQSVSIFFRLGDGTHGDVQQYMYESAINSAGCNYQRGFVAQFEILTETVGRGYAASLQNRIATTSVQYETVFPTLNGKGKLDAVREISISAAADGVLYGLGTVVSIYGR